MGKWCYVDPEKCRKSAHRFFHSNFFPSTSLYYSYSTCNNTHSDFFQFSTIQKLRNTTIKTAIPGSLFPYHFKRTSNGEIANFSGPEYFNDNVPFEGSIIDFLNAVQLNSLDLGVSFEYTYIQSEHTGFSAQRYAATVERVQDGIVDMAAGVFSITEERLLLVPATIPVVVDHNFLWVKKPNVDNSIITNIKHTTTSVISGDLWGTLGLSIFAAAVLNMWFSFNRRNISQKELWGTTVSQERWKLASYQEKCRIVGYAFFNSFWLSWMGFLSGDVDHSSDHPSSRKILAFGLGFLFFVFTAAYTANLAAFLTLQEVGEFIDSVDTAIMQRKSICAITTHRGRIQASFPQADTTFIYKDTTKEVLAAIESNECQACTLGEIIVKTDHVTIEKMCELELGTTGALVISNPYGFFAKPDLVGGLSHIFEVARNDGIDYRMFAVNSYSDVHKPEHGDCSINIDINPMQDDLVALTTIDMILPLLVLAICAVISIAFHLFEKKTKGSSADGVNAQLKKTSEKEEILASIETMKAAFETMKNSIERLDTDKFDRGTI